MGTSESRVNYGSLNNPVDLQAGVEIITSGGIVAAQVRGVFGLWGDGNNPNALELILRAKNEIGMPNRKFSAMMFSPNIFPLVDKSAIHPDLKYLADDPQLTDQIVGCLLHLRLPLKPEAVELLPDELRSENNGRFIVHNLSPAGHPISGLIRRLNDAGVAHIALTTLNFSGHPEITNLREVTNFCAAHVDQRWAIKLVLRDPNFDPNTHFKGSLTIVDTRTASVYRDGNILPELASALLSTNLNTEEMIEKKYSAAPGLSQILAEALERGYKPIFLANLIRKFTQIS
ncbi:MAG: hypothetical protein G01um101416_385 [Microgenomates group bacterium Gr01-1014_16]|nr:MAG: hypothetical protein G01um101416_385 [Microgenomates group bacterium Gr01-1014_16]